MDENTRWEYRVLTVGSFFKGAKDADLQAILDELGQDGWEVVGFRSIETSNQAQVIAKRPLTTHSRRERSLPGW